VIQTTTRLVLLRHGESIWNKEKRLTGWTDIDLSERGIVEAREAGRIFKEAGFVFDVVFTSVLRRAVKTAWLVLDEMNLVWIPVLKSWRLNERHYGVLEGLTKTELERRYGRGRIVIWKWGYDTVPPQLEKDDDKHPRNDPRYRHIDEDELPGAESLRDASMRILPYWKNMIVPMISSGKRVLIVTHGGIMRVLMNHINAGDDEEALNLEVIPTGASIVYDLDENMNPRRHYRLGSKVM